ncbi:hypothetical protein DW222_09225 [Blautia obeum]|uniref:Uncharacterized protein n=1 Tax=Blautia obeum TaxID=40520 RepID=A0A414W1L5_9FIRM|nr:hypothetical protein DW222_09225 [Blautia obeum]
MIVGISNYLLRWYCFLLLLYAISRQNQPFVVTEPLFNIAQKPLFPIIEWIAGSVLKSPFFKDTAVSGRYRRVHFYLL